MSDEVTVFGIFKGAHGDDKYGFVKVLAAVHAGTLVPLKDPAREFPQQGDVFLGVPNTLPARGALVVCDVKRTDKKDVTNAFAAKRVRTERPFEIVTLPYRSSEPEQMKEALLRGVELPPGTSSSVLFELRDGMVIGPLHPTQLDGTRSIYLCKAEDFARPLKRWTSAADIGFLSLGGRRFARRLGQLPPHTGELDCADLGRWVPSVLKQLGKSGAAGVTRKLIREIVAALKQAPHPEELAARAKALQERLSDLGRAAELAPVIAAELAEAPPVKGELARLRERVEAETRAALEEELRGQQTKLQAEIKERRKEVATLKTRREKLRAELGQLESARRAAEAQASRQAEEVEARVRERLEAVQNDAADAYARIALLRPLLDGAGRASGGSPTAPAARAERLQRVDADSLGGPAEAAQRLGDAFHAMGVVKAHSLALAHGVLAAALTGQVITFAGGFATASALRVASALTGGTGSVLRIPAGLLEGRSVAEALEAALERAAGEERVSALLLVGLNRSDPGLYADALRELVVERWPRAEPDPLPLIVGAIASGPAALPLTPEWLELGPVFDVDHCRFRWGDATGEEVAGAVQREAWRGWARELEEKPLRAAPQELRSRGPRSPLWERQLALARRCLEWLDREEPRALLASGWVVPRGLALGLTRQEIKEQLEEADLDLEEGKDAPLEWAKRALEGDANEGGEA